MGRKCHAPFSFLLMTTPDLTCLDGVIGLANCACPCLEQTAPAGWNVSSSGLWLNDLIPLNMADAGQSCDDASNPWNVLNAGRRAGGTVFMNDFRNRLKKRTSERREKYKGFIGELDSRTTITPEGTYAGIRIPTAHIKGGYAYLPKIGGVFSANGSVSVQIYDRFNNAVGDPIVLTTIANKHVETTAGRTLPLWTESGQRQEYFMVYAVNPANLPKAVRVYCPTCGTGALPVFNTNSPYWGTSYDRGKWREWIGVAPWAGDSLTDFDLEAEKSMVNSTGYTNGLTLTIELTCDPTSVVCLGGMDYADEATMSAAFAYYYAAGIQTAGMLLRNPEASRRAAVTAEQLVDWVKIWDGKDGKYEQAMAFAVHNADVTQTDCVFCKSAYSLTVEGKTP